MVSAAIKRENEGMAGSQNRRLDEKDNKRERQAEKRESRRRTQGDYQLDLRGWAMVLCLQSAVVRRGGAIRVGLTRDGGALAIGVYMDNDYATEYIRPSEDLWTAIGEIAEVWIPNGGDEIIAAMGDLGLESWIAGQ